MAKYYGVSSATIIKRLKENNTPIRMERNPSKISEELFIKTYTETNFNVSKTARLLNLSICPVWERVVRLKLPRRDQRESTRTLENRTSVSERMKEAWQNEKYTSKMKDVYKKNANKMSELAHSRIKKYPWSTNGTNSKKGWRTIAGRKIYFRSAWEANYARILQHYKEDKRILEWEFEPQVFWFTKIKRGVRSYLPDFRITKLDGTQEYHEVKGYMDARSKTKIKRMKIYHPTVLLEIIDGKKYRGLTSEWKSVIGSDWE